MRIKENAPSTLLGEISIEKTHSTNVTPILVSKKRHPKASMKNVRALDISPHRLN